MIGTLHMKIKTCGDLKKISTVIFKSSWRVAVTNAMGFDGCRLSFSGNWEHEDVINMIKHVYNDVPLENSNKQKIYGLPRREDFCCGPSMRLKQVNSLYCQNLR